MTTDLYAWGLTGGCENAYDRLQVALPRRARVVAEQRGLMQVVCTTGQFPATISGGLRHSMGADREARPVVGDWVILRAPPTAAGCQIVATIARRNSIAPKEPPTWIRPFLSALAVAA